jgi:hypothetical protein
MAQIWVDLINPMTFDDLCVTFVQPACCKLTQPVEVVSLLYNDLCLDL